MQTKSLIALFSALISGLMVSTTANAENDIFAALTLRGLSKISVSVDGIHRDFEKYGLSAAALKQQIESELSNNGITVTSHEELMTDPQVARLRIKINANENQYRFYHYGIRLELAQKVPMNDKGGYIAETTWTSGQTGVVLPMDLRRLNIFATDLVAIFLKDYRLQNPKVAQTTTSP